LEEEPLNRVRSLFSAAATLGLVAGTMATMTQSAGAETYGPKPGCTTARFMCAEVQDPVTAFHTTKYVGHDEPSTLFYSNVPGSGNRMQYNLTVPKEPAGGFSKTNGYDFELHPAFWFGMAMCDTFSYPETNNACTPDSDKNIVDPTKNDFAPGVAFEELQFYPPGWIPQFAGSSCDPTKWCVALNIDSLSENPFTAQTLNPTCQSQILGGVEYVNFAFLTLNGTPLGPPNPLEFDPSTSGNPRNANTFFLNSGDQATVNLHDTANGLQTTVTDATTGKTGVMVASAANHFGHIVYAPNGTSCSEQDYNFHPMYSTSSPQTRVLWAAHSYNIAYSDEIGHFDFCTHIDANSPTASCDGQEGVTGDQEAADGDDNFCFPAEESLLYPATGCADTNAPGFDGTSYHLSFWPDASSLNAPSTKPTPINFSPPLTGSSYTTKYAQFAFETDLPRIEASDLGGSCVRSGPGIGNGCTNPPNTDDGQPAVFYPYFTQLSNCRFVEGSNFGTGNSFGGSAHAEYGPLYEYNVWTAGGGGDTHVSANNFNSGPINNACTVS
jgi:hypothetical protein